MSKLKFIKCIRCGKRVRTKRLNRRYCVECKRIILKQLRKEYRRMYKSPYRDVHNES
jgi:hypothetical protein